MTSSFLKGNRTRYRNLLEKELEKGKNLISEAEQEEYEVKIFSKNVRNCLRRLNDFIEKLEQTNEILTVAIEGWSGGAKVLGELPVPGRPTQLDYSRARAYCACSRCGWGLFGHFFSQLSLLSFLPLSGRRPDID